MPLSGNMADQKVGETKIFSGEMKLTTKHWVLSFENCTFHLKKGARPSQLKQDFIVKTWSTVLPDR